MRVDGNFGAKILGRKRDAEAAAICCRHGAVCCGLVEDDEPYLPVPVTQGYVVGGMRGPHWWKDAAGLWDTGCVIHVRAALS